MKKPTKQELEYQIEHLNDELKFAREKLAIANTRLKCFQDEYGPRDYRAAWVSFASAALTGYIQNPKWETIKMDSDCAKFAAHRADQMVELMKRRGF